MPVFAETGQSFLLEFRLWPVLADKLELEFQSFGNWRS